MEDKRKAPTGGANQNQLQYTIENRVLSILKDGKTHQRQELSQIIRCADKSIRYAIASLREQGYLIVSSSNSSGYKISEDFGEIQECIRARERRITKEMKVTNAMRNSLYKKIDNNEIEI